MDDRFKPESVIGMGQNMHEHGIMVCQGLYLLALLYLVTLIF
jgi:hypothetical protein